MVIFHSYVKLPEGMQHVRSELGHFKKQAVAAIPGRVDD